MPQINQSLLTEDDKRKFTFLFNQWLLPENVRDIAIKYGYKGNAYVYHVIKFRKRNSEIFNEAIEVALKNKQEHEESIQKIEKDFVTSN